MAAERQEPVTDESGAYLDMGRFVPRAKVRRVRWVWLINILRRVSARW